MALNRLIGNFTFYPVGQGCFYAGSINYNDQEFVIVYDCGTVSKSKYLEDSIKKFRAAYNKIDLLMISHFDKDHVSGIKELLSGIVCERVIIPYYHPLLRLSLYGESDGDDEYTNFIKDPINYLLTNDKFNVNEIIVLENGSDGPNTNLKAPPPDKPVVDNESDGELSIEFFEKQDNGFKKRVEDLEDDSINGSQKVKYLKLPFKLSFNIKIWEFVFYLKDFNNPKGLLNFQQAIDNLLSKTRDGKLSSLFEKTFIDTIKGLYKKHLSNNINYTSLVVYHGPLKENSYIQLKLDPYMYDGFYPSSHAFNRSGTLLTGDSFFRQDADFNPFFNYYSPYYFENCFLFQIPHHGAESNWRLFPNGLESIPFHIANYGWGRKHPFKSVIENIIDNSDTVIIPNNESARVSYDILVL